MAVRNRRPTGDDATNARKRFYRSAERLLKQAAKAVGATASRLRYLARRDLKAAINTYDKKTTQQFSKPIQKLAADLGVNLQEERRKIQERSDKQAQEIRANAIRLDAESRSAKRLSGRKIDIETRREEEARAIMNSPIGKRILGGTVDIWRDEAIIKTVDEFGEEKTTIDRSKILPALFDYFKVDNVADLISTVEEITGETLYAADDQDAFYEAAKILLQTHIATDNSVVQ